MGTHLRLVMRKLLVVFFLAGLSGCGYAFQGSGSVLPPDIKRVYIPLAENLTTEVGLAQTVTEAVRDRFERYGVVYVVETQGEADAVLNLRILNVRRDTKTTTSGTDSALQYDSTLTVAGELRRSAGQLLWRNNSISISKSFATSSNAVVTTSAGFAMGSLNAGDLGELSTREVSRGQERQMLEYMSGQVAKKIYDEAVAPDF